MRRSDCEQFFVLMKLSGGRGSSAALTGMKLNQGGKDAARRRCRINQRFHKKLTKDGRRMTENGITHR